MSRSSAIIVLGALVIITPFAGIPSWLSSIVFMILGILIITIGIFLRAKNTRTIGAAAFADTSLPEEAAEKPAASPEPKPATDAKQSPHKDPLAF